MPSTRSSEPADRPAQGRRRGWHLILAGVLTVGLVAGVLVAVIGVTYQDIPSDSRAFVKQKQATWPQGVDDGGAVASAFGVRAIPQSFFVRADGTIAARVFGFTNESALARPLAQLLGGAPG